MKTLKKFYVAAICLLAAPILSGCVSTASGEKFSTETAIASAPGCKILMYNGAIYKTFWRSKNIYVAYGVGNCPNENPGTDFLVRRVETMEVHPRYVRMDLPSKDAKKKLIIRQRDGMRDGRGVAVKELKVY